MSRDLWLQDHEACLALGREIMEDINRRNREPRGSSSYSKASAKVRTATRQYSNNVAALRLGLVRSSTQCHITQREVERRQGLLDQLVSTEKRIENAFTNDPSAQRLDARSNLLTTTTSTNPFDDTDGFDQGPDLTIGDLRQRQEHAIREQDSGLDALSQVVGRQRQMALDIGNEVDTQNELIDDITDHVDRTDQRLLRETRHIRVVGRKSGTFAMWAVIMLLLLAIVVVCVVPYGGKA